MAGGILTRLMIACSSAVVLAPVVWADAKPDTTQLKPGPLAISASRITSFTRGGGTQTRFGKLDFRGGLVLTAADTENFGGWSGLALDPDGRGFVSVSDSGVWMTGTLVYDGTALSGVENAQFGPLLGQDGKPLKRPRDRDAEAVTLMRGAVREGQIQIAFEQNARIAQYDVSRDGISAPRLFLEKPASVRSLRRNTGLESVTVMRGGPYKGETVAMAERHYNLARNHTGWIWNAGKVRPFYMTNIGDYDVTDIASLDDGSLFVLERRFRWLEGVKMRIRRIGVEDLVAGKTAAGEILLEADLEYQIDNMEGLAVTRSKSGDVILTLISDDNFNHFLQRTLVLQFEWNERQTAKARPQD